MTATPATNESMIPLLPCKLPAETVTFYSALGFTVTHQQTEPYLYIAVRRGALELHFTGSLGVYHAKNPFGACLVLVDGVENYHRAFAEGLRTHYGKVPTADLPRLTRPHPQLTRFKVFDPNGNVFIFIDRTEPAADYADQDVTGSPVEQALGEAEFLRDTYAHDKAAARVLDLALERNPVATLLERARLLAARAELAVALGDRECAAAIAGELPAIPLSAEERARFGHELQAANELAQWIKG